MADEKIPRLVVEDLIKLHDLLAPAATDEVPLDLGLWREGYVRGAHDLLCLMLGHDHNKAFLAVVEHVLKMMRARGLAQKAFDDLLARCQKMQGG